MKLLQAAPIRLTRAQLFREIRSYIIITLCLALYAVAAVGFIINAGIVSGGASGLGTLVYYATAKAIPVGYTVFAINAILIVLAMRILGTGFGLKTIYAIFMMSVFISLAQTWILEPFLPDDLMLSAVIGGILIGTGIGFVFTQGGSTGGTDIVALIINKYRDITPGRLILFADMTIICSGFLIFYFVMDKSLQESFRIVVYGFVVMAVNSYMIDLIILGQSQSVQVFIFSKDHEKIADAIVNELHRGCTVLDGTGWYTKEETKILLAVTRKTETMDLLRLVKKIDPGAFTSIANVSGVYGKGFGTIKTK